MAGQDAPVVIAYDGSEVSRAALREAAGLFSGRPAVVVTVWEPGLATMAVGAPDTLTMGMPPDPATVEAIDRLQREHASNAAAEGAALADSLGLAAEAQAVPDERDVAETVIEIARQRDAGVVVVGSHGISGLRSRLLGSVARKLIERSDRPVLVIRPVDKD
jgi:nucleotide-binding universal stress UspA family protein